MNLIIQLLVLLGMLCSTASAFAAQLRPEIKDKQLGFTLTDVAWPVGLTKDFASGFENKILIRVSALANGKPVIQADIVIFEKYDLWDELFTMKVLVAGTIKNENTFSHVEEPIAQLTKLNIVDVFALSMLPQNQSFILQAYILINPIERERIEHLSQWVAENSIPHVSGGTGVTTLTSKPNRLFNTIYEQYVHGADIAAPWKTTVSSQPFNLQELQTEHHINESK